MKYRMTGIVTKPVVTESENSTVILKKSARGHDAKPVSSSFHPHNLFP